MLKNFIFPLVLFSVLVVAAADPANAETAKQTPQSPVPAAGPDLDIEQAAVEYHPDLDLLVFEMRVAGKAGGTVPKARGSMDGAPALGYVFPTTLAPHDVGFRVGEGIVALVVVVHPDFDDTPLWDENGNRQYDDDGATFHTHWAVLVPDDRVPGGLAVAEITKSEIAKVLPPTHAGMPMLLDSPGYSVVLRGQSLKVLVPALRVNGQRSFGFDAVAAYMEVGPGEERPMLGVYKVYDVLSGDLSLPFKVKQQQ